MAGNGAAAGGGRTLMRILQVVHQCLPHLGGTGVYVQDLSEELSRRGHQVMVFTRRLPPPKAQVSGVMFCSTRVDGLSPSAIGAFCSIFGDAGVERAFAATCRDWQPQVVHFHHLRGLSGRLVAMAKGRGLPVIFTLHDYWFLCPGAQMVSWATKQICQRPGHSLECARCAAARLKLPGSGLLSLLGAPLFSYRKRQAWNILQRADVLIAPSSFLANVFTQGGLPPVRLRLSPLGINLSPFSGQQRPLDKEGRLRVAYIGALAWQKGVHLLVEAANLLSQENLEVRIYGEPQEFPDYVAQLRGQLRYSQAVLAGRLERSEVPQVLARTHVLVIPSLWWENDPLVVKEAFAARVPVVASRLGALAQAVQDGVDGLLFEPGNAADLASKLALLIRDRALLERLRYGIHTPKSIAQDAAELEEVYQAWVASDVVALSSKVVEGERP